MTKEQLEWLAVALSRLVGGYILASSADSPQQLTADYKGYFENFLMKPEWQAVIGKYEKDVLASIPAAPAASGGFPTP